MKKKLFAKKVTAALVTATMVMSMGGMTAFAEGTTTPTEISEIKLKKDLTVAEKTYAPNTEFSFTIQGGSAQNSAIIGSNTETGIRAGLNPELMFTVASGADNNLQFTPDMSLAADGESYEKELTYNVTIPDSIKAQGPGIYHYTIRENNGGFEGITYDETLRDLYVYIASETEADGTPTGELYVYAIICTKNGAIDGGVDLTQGGKTGLSFTNDYGKSNNLVKKLTVTKTVAGNQSNKSDEFTFTVTVNPDNEKSKEWYRVEYIDVTEGSDGELQDGIPVEYIVKPEDEDFATITIPNVSHNDKIVIYGLTKGDEFTVIETDAKGYKHTYTQQVGGTMDESKDNNIISGTLQVSEDVLFDGTAAIKNVNNAGPATGIAMTFAPYAVMVVFAGVFAVMFLRKKREDF